MDRKHFEVIGDRVADYRERGFSSIHFMNLIDLIANHPFAPTENYNREIHDSFLMLLTCYDQNGTERNIGRDLQVIAHFPVPRQGAFHKHNFIEILYVIEGSFDQILLGERLHFEQGTVVITDQNCEHADYIEAKDASILFLQISPDLLDGLLRSYDGNDDLERFLFHSLSRQKKEQSFLEFRRSQTAERNPESDLFEPAGSQAAPRDTYLEWILELLFEEDMTRSAGFSQIRDGLLIRLLHHLCMEYSQELHSNDRESKEKILLYEIERYIRAHAAEVTVHDLEAQFHYHRNYFNLLLQKYRDTTFKKYVQKIRLENAKQLLASTNLSVKEAARRCGYENTSHFYHLYEEMFGEKPRS